MQKLKVIQKYFLANGLPVNIIPHHLFSEHLCIVVLEEGEDQTTRFFEFVDKYDIWIGNEDTYDHENEYKMNIEQAYLTITQTIRQEKIAGILGQQDTERPELSKK